MFCEGGNKEVIRIVCARKKEVKKDKIFEVNKSEEINRLCRRKKP